MGNYFIKCLLILSILTHPFITKEAVAAGTLHESQKYITQDDSQVIAMTFSDLRLMIHNMNIMTDYLLNQLNTSRKKVRIAFVPTASNDSFFEISFFRMYFKMRGLLKNESWQVRVFKKRDLKQDRQKILQRLQDQDIIFIGGGYTKTMMEYWKSTGFDTILRELWDRGRIIFSGGSAGLECWFEKGLTRSGPNEVEMIETLGFLKGSCSPHYQEGIRKYHFVAAMSREDAAFPGYGCQDGSALHFVGQQLVNIIKLDKSAKIHMYEKWGTHRIQ